MTQWEYLYLTGESTRPIEPVVLKATGEQGWEMVAATFHNPQALPGQTYPGVHTAVFKRPAIHPFPEPSQVPSCVPTVFTDPC